MVINSEELELDINFRLNTEEVFIMLKLLDLGIVFQIVKLQHSCLLNLYSTLFTIIDFLKIN